MNYVYIAFGVFFLILILVAYINYAKDNHRFLNPYELFKNILRGGSIFIRSIAGQPVARTKGHAGDSVFHDIGEALLQRSLQKASKVMDDIGCVYKKKSFDCENFAQLAKALFDWECAKELPEGKGIPSQVLTYVDTERGPHAIWFVIVDGKPRYFDGYSQGGTFKEQHLTMKELGSATNVLMG
jgi:hypothetical protein